MLPQAPNPIIRAVPHTLTPLSAGMLWPAVRERARRALACGALRPIETECLERADGGVVFQLRVVSSLGRKDEDRRRRHVARAPDNPFLPYDPDLYVADVSDTHVCLLNKFNVIEHHLLVVTRAFVHQETLLDARDFAALAVCLAEGPALGFYNGGEVAGASQPHKHLQLVPLPLGDSQPPVPMAARFPSGAPGEVRTVPGLGFRHAYARLDDAPSAAPEAALRLRELYRRLLAKAGIPVAHVDGQERQGAPYNLLVTREWMLVVPRSRERFETVSVNALGYAGSLFLRNREELRRVEQAGPMAVLRSVGVEP